MNKSMRDKLKFVLIPSIILLSVITLILVSQFPSKSESNSKIAHISFDDIYEVLVDITVNENKYESIFDNALLGSLKEMNEKYGAKFTLYIYDTYPENNYDIRDVSSKYREEFMENSNWLKFGYHTIEPTTSFDELTNIDEFDKSFTRVNDEITRFAGEESIANVLRLNYFRANAEKIDYLSSRGISGLLCADDDRVSYNLSEDQHRELKLDEKISYNGITYYNTDFRFDGKRFITNEMMKVRDQEILVLFAHEWALGNKGLDRVETAVKWLVKNNYEFSFLE